MKSNKSDNNGFSLIELIVVISVLCILSCISLAVLNMFKEKTVDRLVKTSMVNAYKECNSSILLDELIPKFTVDLGLHSTNGYYKFYQEYDYKIRDNGIIPPTKLGNCLGPLGPHRIVVRKEKGTNAGGVLSINLETGKRLQKNGLTWD